MVNMVNVVCFCQALVHGLVISPATHLIIFGSYTYMYSLQYFCLEKVRQEINCAEYILFLFPTV